MFKRYLYRNYSRMGPPGQGLRRRVTLAGWVMIGATLLAGAQGMDTSASLGYQTFAFLLGVLLLSAIAVRFCGRRLVVTRTLPKYGSVGEELDYTITIQNPSRLTLSSLSLSEQMKDPQPTREEFLNLVEPGEEKRNLFDRTFCFYRWMWLAARKKRAQVQEIPLPDLRPGIIKEVHAKLTPLRRGLLQLTGVVIANPDPFGLFKALRKVSCPQKILILPKRYPMPAFELPGSMKYQQGGVSMASSVGESEEFIALRDYRPGDPLRRMHWKSYAKAGKPVVKEFQDEFFVRHALILDTFCDDSISQLFEEAVSVASSMAFTLQDHDSLLDLMFIGTEAYCFTTGRGVGYMERTLEILASVQTCPNKDFNTLETLVLNHAHNISGCLCILLGWDPGRQRMVQQLKSRGVPLRVLVLTPDSTPLDPGVMSGASDHFHCLPVESVGATLSTFTRSFGARVQGQEDAP